MLLQIQVQACCLLLVLAAAAPLQVQAQAHSRLFQQDDRFLELVISPAFDAQTQAHISDWAQFLSQSLLQVYGRWPRHHWRMTVEPASASADDPIPWAQVIRGDLNTVNFYISPQSTTQRLNQAWTGYHELGHLLIPYRGWGDLWFSEGLATYYQNILQLRMGILSEREAWQRIHDGLMRGMGDSTRQDQPLQVVSDDLHRHGGFMRVYWSGARYFLELDVRLRRQSGGRLSLDTALDRLNRCCAEETLSVPQIIARLDRLNEVILFQLQYEKTVNSRTIAPFDTLFASLGITLADGRVVLQQVGAGAQLRRQIAKKHTLPLARRAGILAD